MAVGVDYADARKRMVDRQLAQRGVRDRAVLAAMRTVPREMFVADELQQYAYADAPLPIGESQTISQPFMVATMLEAAELTATARVLEIGAGSGYAAAVMSRIAARVFAVERWPDLASAARQRMHALGYDNVEIRAGDGTLGWPECAPFDAIVVSAGAPSIPHALHEQLKIGGRLAIPVGAPARQRLIKVVRDGDAKFAETDLGAVAFVPLIGAQGWRV